MTLSALVLSVLSAFPHPPPEAHAHSLADAIATAAHEAPLWATGDAGETPEAIPAGEAATAAVLVAIARHEGGFRPDVARCLVTGDNGRSVGAYQVMRGRAWDGHTRAEICESDELQADLALRVLAMSRRAGLDGMMRAYASGDAGRHTRAGRELAGNVTSACRRFGLICGLVPRWVKGPPS